MMFRISVFVSQRLIQPRGVLLAASVICLLLAGCDFLGANDEEQPERTPTPDFRLQDLEGETFQLSEQQGSVVLLQFFDPSCGLCQSETSELNALRSEYGSDSVQIVGIAVNYESAGQVESFAETYDVRYRVLFNDGRVARLGYGISQTPTTVIVSPEGWIAERITGRASKDDLVEIIDQIFAAQDAS